MFVAIYNICNQRARVMNIKIGSSRAEAFFFFEKRSFNEALLN